MKKHRLIMLQWLMLAVLALAGCAGLRKGSPPGYEGAVLDYAGYDFSVLEGRHIVLDPGHGGRYSGTAGPGGLTEKEVNLAVSLILRDLLSGYGAHVTMTRSADIDLLPEGAQGPLRDDLAARADSAARSDSSAIFLSIHHNSPGVPGSRYNATETYYRMGDTGPSLDLATYLHAQLAEKIGLPVTRLRPGNYYVLRNSGRTAVLGEASYLSHPGVEKKLQGEDARKLEAYSYLLGLVDYLSRGVPLIENLGVGDGQAVQEFQAPVTARVVDEPGGSGIDPQRIEVAVDGAAVEFSYNPANGALAARVTGLANGDHSVSVRVRNLRGNAAREANAGFRMAVPPAKVRVSASLKAVPLDGTTPVRFTAVVSDSRGMPVADSTWVLLEFSDPNIPPRTLLTRGGRVSCTGTPAANRPLTVRASCGDASGEASVEVGRTGESILVLQVSVKGGQALPGQVRVSLPGAGVFNCDEEGWLTVTGLASGRHTLRLESRGFLPREISVELAAESGRFERVELEPVFGGALLGRRITLDPGAGGDNTGETGALGLRESDVNYRVAEFLREYLLRAGATVHLTRDLEEGPGVWDRVVRTERFGAEVLVSLSHDGKPVKDNPAVSTRVYHYSNSPDGKRLATLAAGSLKGFAGRPWAGAMSGYQRILQQVSCPAVQVRAASVGDRQAEDLLREPAILRREAMAVFNALAGYFGWSAAGGPAHVGGRVSDGRGGPVAGAMVLLDGWLPAQCDREGRFLFENAGPGPHRVTVQYEGQIYGPRETEPGRVLELILGAL